MNINFPNQLIFTTSAYKLSYQTLFINTMKNSLYQSWYACMHICTYTHFIWKRWHSMSFLFQQGLASKINYDK